MWTEPSQVLGPGNGEKVAASADYPNTDSYAFGNISPTGGCGTLIAAGSYCLNTKSTICGTQLCPAGFYCPGAYFDEVNEVGGSKPIILGAGTASETANVSIVENGECQGAYRPATLACHVSLHARAALQRPAATAALQPR